MKREREGFRFKSFMVEMVLAHLQDEGADFSDYYKTSTVSGFTEPVQIIDPVNAQNNVSRLYTAQEADAIVDAALDAGDAIDGALAAPTKQETIYYWQKIFSSSFQV